MGNWRGRCRLLVWAGSVRLLMLARSWPLAPVWCRFTVALFLRGRRWSVRLCVVCGGSNADDRVGGMPATSAAPPRGRGYTSDPSSDPRGRRHAADPETGDTTW